MQHVKDARSLGLDPQSCSKGPSSAEESGEDEVPDREAGFGFDKLLRAIGEFGPYQRRIYVLMFLPTIFCAMHKLSWVFLGARVNHRCRLPFEEGLDVPYKSTEVDISEYFEWDASNDRFMQCYWLADNGTRRMACDHGWVYDRTTFGSSAIMEWDLVCDREGMRTTSQSVFMAGVLLGSYIFGYMADVIGRKLTFLMSVIIQVVFGVAAGLAHDYWLFTILRMVVGMTTSGVFLNSYVLAMEMVGPSTRATAGTLCQYYYTVGFLIMVPVAYFLHNDWHMLQIAITIPSLACLALWWVVPESARWLVSKGRIAEAKSILSKAAMENKKLVQGQAFEAMFQAAVVAQVNSEGVSSEPYRKTILRIAKYRKMCLRMFIIAWLWFVCSGSYYGLSLISADLGGNPYYGFLLSAAIEIPAYAMNLAALNSSKMGRKFYLCLFLTIASFALAFSPLVPHGKFGWITITLSLIGKLCITSAYGILYVFTSELYPTVIRSFGMGCSSMAARIGGITCPFINIIGEYWKPGPLVFYGLMTLSGALFTLILPETQNVRLPESLEDGENLGQPEHV